MMTEGQNPSMWDIANLVGLVQGKNYLITYGVLTFVIHCVRVLLRLLSPLINPANHMTLPCLRAILVT